MLTIFLQARDKPQTMWGRASSPVQPQSTLAPGSNQAELTTHALAPVPEGQSSLAQRFQRWVRGSKHDQVPEGRPTTP